MWHPCHSSTCPSDGGPRGWEDWCHSACGLWSMPASAVCQALPECVPAMSLRDAVPLVSGLPATCKGERVIESSCQEPHDDTVWLRSWRKRKSRFLEWSLLGSSFLRLRLSPASSVPEEGTSVELLEGLPVPLSEGLGLQRWQNGGRETGWLSLVPAIPGLASSTQRRLEQP